MKIKAIKNKKGFTLIELLIAMSVVTLIAMAFFTIVNASIKNNKKNEQDIKLLNVATSEIENIREQLKDTNSEKLELNTVDKNTDISIGWSNSGKIDSTTGGNLDKGESKVIINTTVDEVEYVMNIIMTREKKKNTEMYLYDVFISTELKNNNFSKRNIELSTKIFGK